jgi:hypothetical protein
MGLLRVLEWSYELQLYGGTRAARWVVACPVCKGLRDTGDARRLWRPDRIGHRVMCRLAQLLADGDAVT